MSEGASETARQLERLPLFGSLSPTVLDRLARATTTVHCAAGEPVFLRATPADCCYAVTRGAVELRTSSPEGATKVVEIIRPGQTFGEAVMFLRRPFPVDAVPVLDTDLLRIPARAVDDVLEDDPQSARAMLASMSVRLHSLVRDVEMYTVQPARERVVGYISQALSAQPTPPVDGTSAAASSALSARPSRSGPVHVDFLPSKRSVASRLGITPETLSRVLRQLTDEGLITPAGHGVSVLQPARLLDMDARP